MKKVANWIADHLAIVVLVVALVALFVPESFSFIKPKAINWLLGVVMFGMGLTLKPIDFKIVFSRPKDVLIGCMAQFTIMPLTAWAICQIFDLPTELAIGVVLVGSCPGGTASNVITFLAKGDLALSVCMTGVSTLLAPILTPFITYLLVGAKVDVDVWSMFLSIVQIVILPILMGFLINHYFRKTTERVVPYLPMVSTLTIALIVACIVSTQSANILSSSWVLLLVVICHNLTGLILGYCVAKCLKLEQSKVNAVTIEVGMQNSGLATSLATTHFAMYPMAAIPGALFSVWHNFSGAIVANVLKHFVKE